MRGLHTSLFRSLARVFSTISRSSWGSESSSGNQPTLKALDISALIYISSHPNFSKIGLDFAPMCKVLKLIKCVVRNSTNTCSFLNGLFKFISTSLPLLRCNHIESAIRPKDHYLLHRRLLYKRMSKHLYHCHSNPIRRLLPMLQ